MMKKKTAFIVGASGITGGNLISFLDGEEWEEVVAAGTRPSLPDWITSNLSGKSPRIEYLQLDAHDLALCRNKLDRFRDRFTHLFYTAWVKKEDPKEEEDYNVRMFENILSTGWGLV